MSKLSKRLHKNMWSIHNWVGLYAGVVIAILSITGVVALFKVEIDEAFNSKYFHLSDSQILNKRIDITKTVDSLKQVYGNDKLQQVVVPRQPNDNWIFYFDATTSTLDVKAWEIFINPYTAEVVGKRDTFKSIGFFIRNLHVRLYEALYGRYIVGVAGIALLLSTITGFWIYGGFMKKQLFATIRKKRLRITMADFHKLIGVTSLGFNLVIAITGAWLGLQFFLQPVVIGERPGLYTPEEIHFSVEDDVKKSINYLDVLEASKKQFPELEPMYFMPSLDGSSVISILGSVPRTAFERYKFYLTLDKNTLKEVHRYDIRKASFGEKVFYVQESLHFGDWGGIVLKIIYAFFGITSGFLALTGFIIYLKRTENKRKEKPKFVELKPLLLKWTYYILGVILLLFVLSKLFGIVVPSLVVIISLYSTVVFILIRTMVLYIKRKIKQRTLKA